MSHTSLSRRELLASAAGAALLPFAAGAAPIPNPRGKLGIGIAAAGFGHRIRANAAAKVDMVDWAHENGYGGLESRLPPTDLSEARRLRDQLESLNMRILFNIPLPKTDADVSAFDARIQAAHEAGAYCLRAALTQRRYEQFSDFATFWNNFETLKATVARAEPILAKHKVKLALENHKGWRSLEQAAWMKQLGSPWVGVLFDFGNNLSLCEHPEETMNNLMPYIFAAHIKDMAVQPYEDGFLLSEIPLGDGLLDLKKMVTSLRQQHPDMMFNLEMITREPLKIPVYSDKYWATFDDPRSPLPGHDLAKTLNLVRNNPPKKPVPHTAGLSPEAALKLEDENNSASRDYARKNLDL
ncbi:MAG TPA: TIM barrel protein [Bryobacteraceae bacterium]|jgi:sugar phosphate isomerase/epimerase|nr:TIM barrel protein [Bryobacteraceae bacterium]